MALVGRTFGLDPYRLLLEQDDGDDFPLLVRLAAAQYVQRQEAEAAKSGG